VTERIHYSCDNKIGIITIDRPEKRNAMTSKMIDDFMSAVHSAGNDGEAHVLIITGVDGAFCSGADIKEVVAFGGGHSLPESAEDREKWWPIVECPIPVIGAIDGPAVGMGAEITSQCDIRIATSDARFVWNFALRGLVPDSGAGTWLLPRQIGMQKAFKLLYTGGQLTAEDALLSGYVDSIVPKESLMSSALGLAREISRASLFSTMKIKKLIYNGLDSARDDHVKANKIALEECFQSNDCREGMAAFLERRDAQFTGT